MAHLPVPTKASGLRRSRTVLSRWEDYTTSRARLVGCLDAHPVNHRLDSIWPSEPPSIDDWLPERVRDGYYYHARLRLGYFVSKEFREEVLRKGTLVVVTVGRKVDSEDVLAVTGDGTLHLNLTKDTYEAAGISGKKSVYGRNRYVVQINLSSLTAGSKLHERLEWCFHNTLTEEFPLLLNFSDRDTGASLPMTFPPESQARKFPLVVEKFSEPMRRPSFQALQECGRDEESQRAISEILEWIGAAACRVPRIRRGDRADPFVSVFSPFLDRLEDERTEERGDSTVCISVVGLVAPRLVVEVMDHMWKTLHASPSSDVFFLTAHGFQDCPVSWRGKEKGYLANGDNFQGIGVWKHGDAVLWQHASEHDEFNG